MKHSLLAITQLAKWYRQVLVNCAMLNVAILAASFVAPTSLNSGTAMS